MAEEQCIFCMIAQGKISTTKVHEDELCVAFLDIKPATKGHIQVISKSHSPIFADLDDSTKQRVFSIALILGKTLVSKLGATGVSYIINEGAGSGQRVAHASIHVIPRYENDEVMISWPDKQMTQEEIVKYYNEIAALFAAQGPTKQAPKPEPKAEEKKQESKPAEEIKIKPKIPRYW